MDIADLIKYLLTPVAQVLLIIGIAEMIKRLGVPAKFIPLIDLALGLVSGIGIYGLSMDYPIYQAVLVGIALGLSACGLFSGIKNVSQPQWTFNESDIEELIEDGETYEDEDYTAKE